MGWDCGPVYVFKIRGRWVAMIHLTGMEFLGICKFIMMERFVGLDDSLKLSVSIELNQGTQIWSVLLADC